MSRYPQRGFTLIELLVVMVIIAIVTTFAVISVKAIQRDPAKEAAGQLADLAAAAAEQAMMQGQEYGLRIEPHAYSFYVYDGRQWHPIKDDSLFYRRDLGEDVDLALQLEGTPATLAPPPATVQEAASAGTTTAQSAATGGTEQQQDKPQVLLLSSGELPSFRIDVTGAATHDVYTVKGTLADGICIIEPGQTDCSK
ncbi:MAG TPA: type II secretion system minor pseudopilin GspH [Gammaproteobacteria bacterium]|nr:type II secretion system minor pseudopilin GspH [Gammaproteobacteria bacterium]